MMKKTILVVSLAAVTIGFAACKKDRKMETPDSLSGTSWIYHVANETDAINFTDESNVSITVTFNGNTTKSKAFYTYNKPDVTIEIPGLQASTVGKVDRDKMTLLWHYEISKEYERL